MVTPKKKAPAKAAPRKAPAKTGAMSMPAEGTDELVEKPLIVRAHERMLEIWAKRGKKS